MAFLDFFKAILYTPLLNVLILFYDIIPGHDFGLSIIALTVIIRLILSPLSIKGQRSQRELATLNPKIQQIKEKYKKDQVAQGDAMMKLYKEHGISPIAGCLPILIQLPILISLYRVFIAGLNFQSLTSLYSFIPHPTTLNSSFLGLININSHNPYMAIIAGALTYLQAKQSLQNMANPISPVSANDPQAALGKQMLYFMPIFIVIIGWNLPAGLILYWITTTGYSIFEQLYFRKVYIKNNVTRAPAKIN